MLHAVLLTLLAAQLAAAGAPVELSSSVITFYNSDLHPGVFGSPISQCELMVRRAATHGGRRVQFVPTHYWYDARDAAQDPAKCFPDLWASTDLRVDYYCAKWKWDAPCEPFALNVTANFRAGLQACFAVAAQLFDEVLIAPHLDPVVTTKRTKWRNFLLFDPLWKDKHGYSYYDLMLQPILDAANTAFASQRGKTFSFAMGGEMGGTLLAHPGSYLRAMSLIRQGWKAQAQLRTGVTFYHAFVTGRVNHGPGPEAPIPDSPLAALDGGYGPLLPLDRWPNVERLKAVLPDVRKLLEASDFIGVSNYARAPPAVKPADIEGSTAKLVAEFKAMGIDLGRMLAGGKTFIWNEFGLGGGISSCGDTPGRDARIGLFPWLGITSGWKAESDPFRQSSAVKAYQRAYYAAALQLLQAGGGKWPVAAAYIWSCASWDVQGVHTSAAEWNLSIAQGDWPVKRGYADAGVIAAIREHNARARR